MNEPVIELKQLSKMYGDFVAVSGLTLEVMRGEIFGLLGPNGAGKSTSILMMLGLSEPTSGSVRVCGIDSTRDPIEVKRRVGYLPDDVGFYEDRTGFENLMLTARLNGYTEQEGRDKALALLDRVGLGQAKDKKTGAYSRGMRQRLGLADVLIKSPEVIILDEPTLGIDPTGVKELLELIRSLSRDEGITVLLSSHHLHQVQQICDRVGLFVKGRLIACGDVPSLSKQLFAKEPLRIELEARPLSDGLARSVEALEGITSCARHGADRLVLACERNLAGDIARLIADSDAELVKLQRVEFGLDEIYHRYFEGGVGL